MPYAIDETRPPPWWPSTRDCVQRSREPVTGRAQRLLDEEHARRGAPDATGALNPLALPQGTLLKEEFDLSTHAHHEGWRWARSSWT